MGLPKEVKVGDIVYKVKTNVDDELNDNNWFGYLDCEAQIIGVRSDIHPDRQKQVLCHEICHAIIFECGLAKLSENEAVVGPVGNMLMSVLRDNSFKWVKD